MRKTLAIVSPSPEELFNALLKSVQPSLVADIGSRDATESKRFKRLCPTAAVLAIEPHPALYEKMLADAEVKVLGVEPINFALSNQCGTMKFYINDSTALNGSLRKTDETAAEVDVEVERLDAIMEGREGKCVFLWIDAEGLAWEVLAGAEKTLDRVACIHLEYETKALFEKQRTLDDVEVLLARQGFRRWADSYCREVSQGNALFLRPTRLPMPAFLRFLLTYPWYAAKAVYRKLK
jgi:FkbM family methyltransferase